MGLYKHNIASDRDTRITVSPQTTKFGVQFAVGTAPVNLLADPSKAVNKPLVIHSLEEAKKLLGWSNDTTNYTLMQTVIASFQKFAVAPIVCVNVLDPSSASHKTAVTAAEFTLTGGKTKISVEGVILSTVVVTYGEEFASTATVDTDYVLSFDNDGYVDLAVTPTGAIASATSVKIAYSKLTPSGVTSSDIIGTTSAAGVRTGLEIADEVYMKTKLIPSILTAPGFSNTAAVAAALDAKTELMGDLLNGIALVDLPADNTTTPATAKTAKATLGADSRRLIACYPNVKVGGKVFQMSVMVAALLQYICASSGDIPGSSPDNKELPIDGVCFSDGKEVFWDQSTINDNLNAYGIFSCLYLGGWKGWGNNTTAFPDDTNPNDRFIKNVMISNYLENRFKTEYLSSIGNNGSVKEMESIVTNYNADLNSLVPDHLAGAYVVFDKKDNPMSEILVGHWKFHTFYADWVPTEYVENLFTWDSSILEETFA